MSIPMICAAAARASSGVRASLMPPALPRPPTGTWALTATGPSSAHAAAASAGVRATLPGGIAMPSEARTSLAWYSRSFKLSRGLWGRVEGARQVLVAARVAVAKPALEVGVADHEDRQADPEDEHDHEREAATDEHRRHRRDATAGGLGTGRPPGRAVPVLRTVVGDPATLRVLSRHGLSVLGQAEAPVVARHPVALRVLELALAEQLESQLPADRVRRGVVDRRKGVHLDVTSG